MLRAVVALHQEWLLFARAINAILCSLELGSAASSARLGVKATIHNVLLSGVAYLACKMLLGEGCHAVP